MQVFKTINANLGILFNPKQKFFKKISTLAVTYNAYNNYLS